jgi:hypothetical protein
MAIKPHPTPCIKCRWVNYKAGFSICQRPIAARSCPVVGIEVITVDRPAKYERKGRRVWFFFRKKCGPIGKYFLDSQLPKSPPPPQIGE